MNIMGVIIYSSDTIMLLLHSLAVVCLRANHTAWFTSVSVTSNGTNQYTMVDSHYVDVIVFPRIKEAFVFSVRKPCIFVETKIWTDSVKRNARNATVLLLWNRFMFSNFDLYLPVKKLKLLRFFFVPNNHFGPLIQRQRFIPVYSGSETKLKSLRHRTKTGWCESTRRRCQKFPRDFLTNAHENGTCGQTTWKRMSPAVMQRNRKSSIVMYAGRLPERIKVLQIKSL